MGNDFEFGGHNQGQGYNNAGPEDGNPVTESSRMRKRLSDVGLLLGMVAIVVAVLAVLSSLDIEGFARDASDQAESADSSQSNDDGNATDSDETDGGGTESGGELARKPNSGGAASGGVGSLGGGSGIGGTPVEVDDIIIKNGNSGGVLGRWVNGVFFEGDVDGWLNLRRSVEPMTGLLNREGVVRNGTESSAKSTDVAVTTHSDGTIVISKDGEVIGLLRALENSGGLDGLQSVGDVTIDADTGQAMTSPDSGGRINQTGAQIFDMGGCKALVRMEDGSTAILGKGDGIRFNSNGTHEIGRFGQDGFNVGVDDSCNITNDADVDITEAWSEADKDKWNQALEENEALEQAQAEDNQPDPADQAADEDLDEDADSDSSTSFDAKLLLYAAAAIALLVTLGLIVTTLMGRNKADKKEDEVVEDEVEEPTGPPMMAHEDAIRSSLEEQIQAITLAADPRMAIQQAYLLAEGGFGVPSLSRRPSESPGEFVHRCVGGFGQPDALRELVRLFEIARYSREPVTEAMRSDARAALIALKDAVGTDDRMVL